MKKIIIEILLVAMCFCCGCGDKDMIEFIESDTANEQETTLDEANIDETAENIETNDSRPFVVYVTGEVKKPGVFEIAEDKRVIDAIDAAGGYTKEANISYLNLASPLSDGQMIYVPSNYEVENSDGNIEASNVAGLGGIQHDGGDNKLININTAGKEELMTLPGIGESKAEKIISYRETNGKFSSKEGIMEISGIKEGLYNKVKDRICVR